MKKIFVFLLFVMIVITIKADSISPHKKPLLYWGLAVNNFVTAKPITGFPKVFYSQFHPGITVSTGFNWTEKPKHNLMQSFKAGYFSHRFVQRSIMLYSEFGYRYKAGSKFGLSIALGAGYLHMIPATQQFTMNDNGDWEKKKLKSRPQALISLSMGIDYKITDSGIRTFIRYQNMLQTPFVPGYVPLLPYNVLHLGVTVPVSVLKKGAKND
ncbi:MAG: hypothetical protein V4613_00055 [Bacteroidota bacterium]